MVAGIAFVKAIRANYLNALSGNKEVVQGVRLTKDGFPVALGPLIKHLRAKEIPVSLLQFLNTILFSTRSLKTGAMPDYSSITAPSKRRGQLQDISLYCDDF